MKGIYRATIPLVGPKHAASSPDTTASRKKAPINPFPILGFPDIVVSLVFTGVVYAVNYTVTSTISSAFAKAYPWLSETVLGLSYLPTGLGMIIGSTFCGKLLDWDYARMQEQYKASGSIGEFPIEKARLRTMPAHLVIFVAALLGWGWVIQERVHMAVPLVLQVICESLVLRPGRVPELTFVLPVGWTSIAILNTTMTLNVDVLQKRSSAATACVSRLRSAPATMRYADPCRPTW